MFLNLQVALHINKFPTLGNNLDNLLYFIYNTIKPYTTNDIHFQFPYVYYFVTVACYWPTYK